MAKKSVSTVEKVQTVVVRVDMEVQEILQLNATPGVRLVWDPIEFKAIAPEVVKQLSEEAMESYFTAKAANAKRAEQAAKQVIGEITSPLDSRASYRLRIRERKGWHSCWKAPGQDFDVAMAGPYKQVRKPTAEQEKNGYEPGEESGEVLKLLDGEGRVELIAVECRQDLYDQHLEAMCQKSTRMYTATKERFFESVEDINRGVHDRSARLKPVDESGEVQA